MAPSGLPLFHPLIQQWFVARYGTSTDIQEKTWPVVAAGGHVLVTAPTGCGKTLAAFLWALNQLITGGWTRGTAASVPEWRPWSSGRSRDDPARPVLP